MRDAIELIEKAGGFMSGDVASVPIGENFENVDALKDCLNNAGFNVLAGNVSFLNKTQLLKITKA